LTKTEEEESIIINRSARSTYPEEKSVSRSGATPFYTALDIASDHSQLLVRDGQPVFLHDKILHYGAKFLLDYTAPAGLLNGTIRDLVKWEMALFDGKVLKASTLKEMSTPYNLSDGRDGDFGLGFTTGKIGRYATVSYEGGAAAWRLSVPVKHSTVIVLTNLQGSSPDTLAAAIARLYDPTIVNASGRQRRRRERRTLTRCCDTIYRVDWASKPRNPVIPHRRRRGSPAALVLRARVTGDQTCCR
jgi:CubicO group peptidase (beta-lactamase class C family)